MELATQEAIGRELEGGAVGICETDLSSAIRRTLEEQRHLDHRDELADFIEPFKKSVTEIERVRPAHGGN